MSPTRVTLSLIALTLLPADPAPAEELKPGPYVLKPISDDFQRLAKIAGEWRGTKEGDGEGPMEVTVEYYLSSGNTALVERLFKGTPMEMTSIYHDDRDGLMMTHYCGLGNQPRYRAEGFDDDASITFAFHDASNMASPDERHMRGVKLTLVSDDEMIQEWSHYHGGKETVGPAVKLKRVK